MPLPIITHLTDVDAYKLSMSNALFQKGHSQVPVVYEFKNRTKDIDLKDYIKFEDLCWQLNYVANNTALSCSEYNYLRSLGLFSEDFLRALWYVVLPPLQIEEAEKDFIIRAKGTWFETILWETIILSVVNELYVEGVIKKEELDKSSLLKEHQRRTTEKINILQKNPWIKFIEFGTRRRAGSDFQDQLVRQMREYCPGNLIGTSNVYLAKKYGLKPSGTQAHELFMVYSGIYRDELLDSHNHVLRDWWDVYGYELSIALNDTYGSDFFWDDFTPEQANNWKGWREDSGDPMHQIPQGIKALEGMGIDPKTKLCVPSDGLDLDKIIEIGDAFKDQVKLAFGWGTNLTFDLPDIRPVSIVVKAVEANGHGLVKLSNNLNKAIGEPKDIELFKKTFGYTSNFKEECKY